MINVQIGAQYAERKSCRSGSVSDSVSDGDGLELEEMSRRTTFSAGGSAGGKAGFGSRSKTAMWKQKLEVTAVVTCNCK